MSTLIYNMFNMPGFAKLFQDIVTSSIWNEDDKTRIVWVTMLVMATKDGLVNASVGGLAHLARVSKEECETALAKLQSPDSDSRSKEHQGRRVAPVDGGWIILNHQKYRDKLSISDRKDYKAAWQRSYRKRIKNETNSGICNGAQQAVREGLNHKS